MRNIAERPQRLPGRPSTRSHPSHRVRPSAPTSPDGWFPEDLWSTRQRPPSHRVGIARGGFTETLRFPPLAFLPRAHHRDRRHCFPELVPGCNGRWAINVDADLTGPFGCQEKTRGLVVLGIERGCTGHDILRASNIRGSRSSTSGSPATPNTRACFVALIFANIDTQDFHAGPGVEVGSHLTRGLYLAIATLILLSPPKVVTYRKLRKKHIQNLEVLGPHPIRLASSVGGLWVAKFLGCPTFDTHRCSTPSRPSPAQRRTSAASCMPPDRSASSLRGPASRRISTPAARSTARRLSLERQNATNDNRGPRPGLVCSRSTKYPWGFLTAECPQRERNVEQQAAVAVAKGELGLVPGQEMEYVAAAADFEILAVFCAVACDFEQVSRRVVA